MTSRATKEQEGAALQKLLAGTNYAEFAKHNRLPGGASMLSQHLSGHRPISLTAARVYASGLGVPISAFSPRLAQEVSALIAGEKPSSESTPIDLDDNPDYPAIRRVRFKLSAGISGFAVEYLNDDDAPIVFRRQWFESNGYNPKKLFAVRVANGSMETGLHHGDTVVVNTEQTEPKDGIVFAVNYEGEQVIKRLVRDAGQWWLVSDNPNQAAYPRKVCGEGVFLIGEVVHKQSERI